MQKREILKQLNRVFNGPAWHGPSVTETLNKLNKNHALNNFNGSHTIIQILAHMVVWRRFVIEKLNENSVYDVTEEQNFPTAVNLPDTIQQLKTTQLELVHAIEIFPEEKLREKVMGREYSFQTMLHGILHHDLYHLGQLALLNR